MEDLRAKIREVTLRIVELYAERMSLVKRVAELKRKRGSAIRDEGVETRLWEEVSAKCRERGLDQFDCRRIFSFLISSSIRAQIPEGGGAGPHVEVFKRAKEIERSGNKVYHLEVGEPPWSFPPAVLDSLVEAIKRGETRYGTSLGTPRFKEVASEWLSRRDGVDTVPEEVIPTPGSKYAIFSILSTFLRPGDRVGVLLPAWPAYRGMASHLSLEMVEIRSTEDIEKLRGVRAFILCSPNNPDGKVWSKKELESLAEVLRETDALLISDDAYAELSFVDRTSPSRVYENTISVNTLSKAFGMTGFRLGYVRGDEEKVKRLAKFLGLTITNVPEFIQEAGASALESADDWTRRVMDHLISYLDLAMRKLEGAPLEINRPDGALYLFPKVKLEDFDSMDFAFRLLEDRRIAVAPGSGFGPYDDRLRITYASPDADQGLRLLREALQSWKS